MKPNMRLIQVILLLAPGALIASDFSESHCLAAERLIEIEGGKASYEEGVKQALMAQIQVNPQMAKFQDVIVRWQQEYIGWDKLKPMMVEIMCKAYTEEEIAALEVFYRTDAGSKLLEKEDQVVLETMGVSQRLAMENQFQLNLMIRERIKELELEVKNLFPEWTDSPEEEDPLKKEYVIFRSSSFSGGDMNDFVYPLNGAEIKALPEMNPFDDRIPISMSQALNAAYQEFYKELNISPNDFEKEASIGIETYDWNPGSTDIEERTVRFYRIDVGLIFAADITDPPAVVVLSNGEVLRPKKKTK